MEQSGNIAEKVLRATVEEQVAKKVKKLVTNLDALTQYFSYQEKKQARLLVLGMVRDHIDGLYQDTEKWNPEPAKEVV